MTIDKIRKEAPEGARGYAEIGGNIYYFIKSNYGWRQIKGNMIQFDDSHVDDHIKPLF